MEKSQFPPHELWGRGLQKAGGVARIFMHSESSPYFIRSVCSPARLTGAFVCPQEQYLLVYQCLLNWLSGGASAR